MPKKAVKTKSVDPKKKSADSSKGLKSEGSWYHRTILFKTFKAISERPKLFYYMLLLDIAFLAVFLLLTFLLLTFLPNDPAFITTIQSNVLYIAIAVLVFIAYIVILVLVYSFLKLVILGNVKKYSTDYLHDYSLFKRMFGLNMLLFLVFFIYFIIFNIALNLLINVNVWIALSVLVILSLIGIMLYGFWNFTHAAFILGYELKDNLKKSLNNTFTKSYFGVYLFSLIVLIVYAVLSFALTSIFRQAILNNYTAYTYISSIITMVVVYLLFCFDSLYFFFVAEKHIGHKRKA